MPFETLVPRAEPSIQYEVTWPDWGNLNQATVAPSGALDTQYVGRGIVEGAPSGGEGFITVTTSTGTTVSRSISYLQNPALELDTATGTALTWQFNHPRMSPGLIAGSRVPESVRVWRERVILAVDPTGLTPGTTTGFWWGLDIGGIIPMVTPGFGFIGDGTGNWTWAIRNPAGAVVDVQSLAAPVTSWNALEVEVVTGTPTSNASVRVIVNGAFQFQREWTVDPLPLYTDGLATSLGLRRMLGVDTAGMGRRAIRMHQVWLRGGPVDRNGILIS